LKKVAIADQMAITSNAVFNNYTDYSGFQLLIGIFAFAIQIYCDFSGYSDMARGVARLLGFELMVNFRLPYFALNPTDFWNRWHISLSTWLRDYLYIPLGGNRHGVFTTYRNLALTMLLGGLWHGASWNFVLWGAYHGTILILYRRFEKRSVHEDPWSTKHNYGVVVFKMIVMFLLTLYGWLLFRAETLEQISYMSVHIFAFLDTGPHINLLPILFYCSPLLLMQLLQYRTGDLLYVTKLPLALQPFIHAAMIFWLLVFGNPNTSEFIYFQF
jgi:D-alanyl-lipoteichoic acid acyltransferase DltB (MBOAT superfamily)